MKFENINLELLDHSIKQENNIWNFKDIEHVFCSANIVNFNILGSDRKLGFFFSCRQDGKEKIIQVFSDMDIPGRHYVILKRRFWGLNKKQFEGSFQF